jgi:hypothetical protein
MTAKDGLALRKARSLSLLPSAKPPGGPTRKLSSGRLMGRMFLIVSRKQRPPTYPSDHSDYGTTTAAPCGPFDDASFLESVDIDDADEEDLEERRSTGLDHELSELQRKEHALRVMRQRELAIAQLMAKERELSEGLHQLQKRELLLRAEQLRGQLTELQIEELRDKERRLVELREREVAQRADAVHHKETITPQLSPVDYSGRHAEANGSGTLAPLPGPDSLEIAELPEPKLDFVSASSLRLSRGGSGNTFGNRLPESLPEPQLHDLTNPSITSGVGGLTDTLKTYTSDIKFELCQTSSRILADATFLKGGSEVTLQKDRAPLTPTLAPPPVTSTAHLDAFGRDPLSPAAKRLTAASGTTASLASSRTNGSTLADMHQNRLTRKYLKIKIYNRIREDEVLVMKVTRDEIGSLEQLIGTIVSRTVKLMPLATVDAARVKLAIVNKSNRDNAVLLTPDVDGTRLAAATIMDYVFSKDKIYVQAEI